MLNSRDFLYSFIIQGKTRTDWVKLFKQYNPLSAKFIKWSNATNCLSVFDHFVGLALKGLNMIINELIRLILTIEILFVSEQHFQY